jgi:hypothetical protein
MPNSSQVIHIHPSAPAKPPFGAPCNGCGVCCLAEPCPLGQWVSLRRRGECKALIWSESGGLYRCGMVENPADQVRWLPRWAAPMIRRLALRWIASARGCDCTLGVSRPGDAPS